jgi:hypothetical protein
MNGPASSSPLERHYSVTQIAEQWNVSDDTVRKQFFDEPGVLRIGQASRLMGGRQKKLKRHYIILRIPESVLMRVQDRLMHKRPAERSDGGGVIGNARSRGGAGRNGNIDIHAAS